MTVPLPKSLEQGMGFPILRKDFDAKNIPWEINVNDVWYWNEKAMVKIVQKTVIKVPVDKNNRIVKMCWSFRQYSHWPDSD